MRIIRLFSGKGIAALFLFGVCAACAESDGSLRAACVDGSLTAKPAACGGDLQRQLDAATRATTDIQRVRQQGGGVER